MSLLFILIYLFFQFKHPTFFSLEEVNGEVFKYKYAPNKKHKDSKLFIWLNDTLTKPYKLSYKAGQEKVDKELGEFRKVKLWVDNDGEIEQFYSNNKKIIEYSWFLWLHSFFLVFGVIYFIIMYKALIKSSVNINTFSQFWLYYFGEIPLIIKRTNKTYDSKDFS